ncbi:MAG: O-antigen ligase family protein [Acetobacteraceae bacterium]|nr:O-antigen ligase family protein [Acetobacteraceae bacterium]
MDTVFSPAFQRFVAASGAAGLLLGALLLPEYVIYLLPAAVVALAALVFYQFPIMMVAVLVLTYGLALDIQIDMMAAQGGGSAGAALGAVVKVVPFALAAVLVLRYGISDAVNWPFLTFVAIAGASMVILPIGRVAGFGDMVRSLIGSTAPFVLGFALAPRRIWRAVIIGAALVPVISAVASVFTDAIGFYPMLSRFGRFQGMHSAPFLAGFCVTAIFACTLEYLRDLKLRWLALGGVNLAILLATQARAPFIAVSLFLFLVFVLSGPRILPLKRKVDLVMGGMVPALLLLGPALLYALQRFTGESENFSGRDIIWPYFLDAIEHRPLFGFGLGAGKLIVDPEDPTIKLLGSNAAHNEYLRLAVDAGVVGCAAIFLSIILWIWNGTRRAAAADQLVLRCALVAALLHSGFDNTLIASTAVVQFCFFAAAIARARSEADARHRHHPPSRQRRYAYG